MANTAAVPVWSSTDSDAVARDLGGASYGSLSPGLKSIVQRVATIVTGDFKPPMPDDGWASWMPAEVRAAYEARPDQRFDWSKVTVSAGGPAAVKTVCDAGTGSLQWVCQTTRAAAAAVGAAVDFATDPLGWLTGKMAAGASGLMGWVSGVANHATAPDLTATWWLDAYRKGMAVGVLLFAMVLMWQLFAKARGRIDAQELMETFTVWAPAYFLGVVFGPPTAQFLIVGAGYLSDGLIGSMTGFNAGDAADQVGSAITGAGAGTVLGGAVVALVVLLLVIIAALLIFVSLAAQAVTIYLAGAVFGVALAWIVSAKHRGGSLKIPMLFLGIVFSRPLLFFLLGVGLALTRAATSMTGDTAAANLAVLVMAIVVLCMAAFAPLLLLKFAPVTPTGMHTGGGMSGGSPGVGAAAGSGLSRLGIMADNRATRRAVTAPGAAGRAAPTDAAPGSGGAATAMATPPSVTSRAVAPGTAGAVAARLHRAPHPSGGPPSPRAARIAAAAPPAGSTPAAPARSPAVAPARSSGAGPTGSAAGAGGGSSAGPGTRSPTEDAGPVRSAGPGSRRAAVAAPASLSGSALSAMSGVSSVVAAGTAAAQQAAAGLDGDQEWVGRS